MVALIRVTRWGKIRRMKKRRKMGVVRKMEGESKTVVRKTGSVKGRSR